MEDLRQLWVRIGDLTLTGVLLLPQTRRMTRTLAIVASRRRHQKNNTYVADELGTSRRIVRETDDLATLYANLVDVEESEGVRADAPDRSIALPPRHRLVQAAVFGGDNCECVVTEQPEPEQPEPEQPEPEQSEPEQSEPEQPEPEQPEPEQPEQRWCSTRRTKKPVACSDCDWTGARVNVGTKPCPRCGGVVALRDAQPITLVSCSQCKWKGERMTKLGWPCPNCNGPVDIVEPVDDDANAQPRVPVVRSGGTWGV